MTSTGKMSDTNGFFRNRVRIAPRPKQTYSVSQDLEEHQKAYLAEVEKHRCICGRGPKIEGRNYCRKCGAEYQAKLRLTHPLTEEQRRRRNAHSYAWTMVKRGKLSKLPCEICQNPLVKMYHDDPEKPLEVRWLCHAHRPAAVRDLI